MDCKVMTEELRKVSPETANAINDILSEDQQISYKVDRKAGDNHNVSFTPGLPNEDIMQNLMNNKDIVFDNLKDLIRFLQKESESSLMAELCSIIGLDKNNKIIMRSGLILSIDAWVKSYLDKR